MLLKDNGGGDFEQPSVGSHIAICTKLIDLGTQKGEYQGKATFKRQMIIGWELPNELMTEGENQGKPFMVSKFYTASLAEKANLRADLKNWRGRDFTEAELAGFEAKNLLGKPCMLSLTLNVNNKIRITGVMALAKGTNVPKQHNPNVFFSLQPDEFDQKAFNELSEGYKKMIAVSPEYLELTSPSATQGGNDFETMDDDIPF